MRMILAVLVLMPISSLAQSYSEDVYGNYGSVPGYQQVESHQDNSQYQQRMDAATYALTPGPAGTQGSIDDTRLQMDHQQDLINNPALSTDNPNVYP